MVVPALARPRAGPGRRLRLAGPGGRGAAVVSVLILAVLVAACGRRGAPEPPLGRRPLPPAGLEARQSGARVLVSLTAPMTTPAGQPLAAPVRAQVLLLVTDRLAEGREAPWEGQRREREYLRRAKVVLELPVEPASRRQGLARVQGALPGEVLDALRPERSSLVLAARLVDGKGRRSPVSERATLSTEPAPAAPSALRARPEESGIRLGWDPPSGPPPARWHVYRRDGEGDWPARPLLEIPAEESSVLDETARYGRTYAYALRAAARPGPPYVESEPVEAETVRYRDVFPPPVPEELRVLETAAGLRLVWFWGSGSPAALYRIERAGEETGFTEVGQVGHPASDWVDTEAATGRRYRYRVIAEDAAGNRSDPSEAVEGVLRRER